MAISRYKDAVEFINATEGYKKTFKKRYGEKGIRQYSYGTLTYPTQEDYNNIEAASVVWKVGDRFYKLAGEYYGSPELWWIIAWFNKKPTEQHVALGEVILVPLFLDEALSIFGL